MSLSDRLHPTHAIAALASGLACVLLAAPAWSDDEPVTNPLGSGASVTLEPVAAPPVVRGQRVVFVCRDAGVPVFSDRPCSPATALRSLEFAEPEAGAVATTVAPAPRASTLPQAQPRSSAPADRAAPSRCASLQRQLDDLDGKMRAGYSAREAARLWNRWRDLKSRLRAEHC